VHSRIFLCIVFTGNALRVDAASKQDIRCATVQSVIAHDVTCRLELRRAATFAFQGSMDSIATFGSSKSLNGLIVSASGVVGGLLQSPKSQRRESTKSNSSLMFPALAFFERHGTDEKYAAALMTMRCAANLRCPRCASGAQYVVSH
jgi:hypothetical protein